MVRRLDAGSDRPHAVTPSWTATVHGPAKAGAFRHHRPEQPERVDWRRRPKGFGRGCPVHAAGKPLLHDRGADAAGYMGRTSPTRRASSSSHTRTVA